MPETLSIAIIARNEERHIDAALESARPLADELIVLLDPRTTDRTAERARKCGAIVHESRFLSFSQQRNRALAVCSGDWVLFLDADERITPELLHEIRAVLAAPRSQIAGYWLPRRNLYFGRALKGGGWYPDHQLRLLRRAAAHYDETRLVHEFADLDGPAARLHGHLLHINIETWPELHEKQRRYALAEAQTLARAGVYAKWRNLVLQPLREIKRRFVTWQGYRDGWLGFVLALTLGYYEWIKYVHLKGLGAIVDERA